MDLRKLKLIFNREYLTRIRKKSFIWSTILVPVGLLLIIAFPVLIQLWSSDSVEKVAIIDETNAIYERFNQLNSTRYVLATSDEDQIRQDLQKGKISAYMVIANRHIENDIDPELIYKSGGIQFLQSVTNDVRSVIRNERLNRIDVTDEVKNVLKKQPDLVKKKLTEEGKAKQDNSFALSAFGYVMAFFIYGAMFGYGAIIMRSVIEEKTNRIVEVIASSVKPVELMIGKVLGVGALGLTQFAIWSIASIGILAGAGPMMAFFSSPEGAAAGEQAAAGFSMPEISPMIWVYFILYYLFGYLIYSALFAAVGSAVDSESDAQQLQIPLMVPIILALVLMPQVITDPNSTLAIVTSLIPIFSPILMVARIPIIEVPFWQIGLSFVLMTATFYLFMLISAKIYKVGILMYGKKASFKELAKWVRY